MDRFETPNPDELQPEVLHNYDLVPHEYPITDNRATNTYDQFIMLRDTLVYSKKYYEGKAWATLIVGEQENTVEVKRQNKWMQKMNSWWRTTTKDQLDRTLMGPYVDLPDEQMIQTYGPLSIKIKEDWYYRIMHKEEVINLPDNAKKVRCYVDHNEQRANGKYPQEWTPIAVFDRECDKTLSWSTSWTDPNGSCSIGITLGKLFNKMTSFGIIERNLKRNDILVLRMLWEEKQNDPSQHIYHDVTLQDNRSNRWSVEYLNLPLKD